MNKLVQVAVRVKANLLKCSGTNVEGRGGKTTDMFLHLPRCHGTGGMRELVLGVWPNAPGAAASWPSFLVSRFGHRQAEIPIARSHVNIRVPSDLFNEIGAAILPRQLIWLQVGWSFGCRTQTSERLQIDSIKFGAASPFHQLTWPQVGWDPCCPTQW